MATIHVEDREPVLEQEQNADMPNHKARGFYENAHTCGSATLAKQCFTIDLRVHLGTMARTVTVMSSIRKRVQHEVIQNSTWLFRE